MEFTVMNRPTAKKYSYGQHGHKYVIISINDMNQDPNRFNHTDELVGVLSLFFDDVSSGEDNCIVKSDAVKIIKFLNSHMNVDECVVHCSAGVSRSAGVAAALMKIVNGSDKPIFEDPHYKPNSACYTMVLNTYFGSYNEEAIEEPYKQNIERKRRQYVQ